MRFKASEESSKKTEAFLKKILLLSMETMSNKVNCHQN